MNTTRRPTRIRFTASSLLACAAIGFLPDLPADEKNPAPAPGKQVEQKLSAGTNEQPAMKYLLFLPKGYKQGSTDKQWPLVFFLHGRGESYGPLSLVKKWGPPRIVESKPDFPYIVVSPQCPGKESWSQPRQQKLLDKLLNKVVKQFHVDEDRILLTGLSMGGFGSWTLAASHPNRFAAVVPICGGGNPDDADKLKSLPIWIYHGDKDTAVPIEKSRAMVDAIHKAGGTKIKFTTLEGVGHNSWSTAYANPDLFTWLDKQSASANRKTK